MRSSVIDITAIQKGLDTLKWEGWLIYDFRRSNDVGLAFLQIPEQTHLTRRLFYWIPRSGKPIKLVSGIEPSVLDTLPGDKLIFHSWQELEKNLSTLLKGRNKIAMEYSPRNAIPSISKVDCGTAELIQSFGVEIMSSANLLQQFAKRWSPLQLESHLKAALFLDETVDKVWKFIELSLKNDEAITEFLVQQFILEQFNIHGFVSDSPPICAVNGNSAIPHYCPSYEIHSLIKKGDFILIDLWCKSDEDVHNAMFADIARVGIAAPLPSEEQVHVFNVVKQAQDAGFNFLKERFKAKKEVKGFEVDDVCRQIINDAGYGQYFIHRTGHNIDTQVHGPGVQLDNYETHDEREILPGTCSSLEPAIYLPGKFGVRLEYDVYIGYDGTVSRNGGHQESLITMKFD